MKEIGEVTKMEMGTKRLCLAYATNIEHCIVRAHIYCIMRSHAIREDIARGTHINLFLIYCIKLPRPHTHTHIQYERERESDRWREGEGESERLCVCVCVCVCVCMCVC